MTHDKDMIYNAAYGHLFRPALVGDMYDNIDSSRSDIQLQRYPATNLPAKSLKQKPKIKNDGNILTRINVTLAAAGIGVVIAIVLAMLAMILVGVLFTSLSSSSHEIQSLEEELQLLKEMINTQGIISMSHA